MDRFTLLGIKAASLRVKFAADPPGWGGREFETGLGVPRQITTEMRPLLPNDVPKLSPVIPPAPPPSPPLTPVRAAGRAPMRGRWQNILAGGATTAALGLLLGGVSRATRKSPPLPPVDLAAAAPGPPPAAVTTPLPSRPEPARAIIRRNLSQKAKAKFGAFWKRMMQQYSIPRTPVTPAPTGVAA